MLLLTVYSPRVILGPTVENLLSNFFRKFFNVFCSGDPSGHDPVECVALLAERSVTLYTIGCEPAATPYRDFFMALAFKTGGQYIPLANCTNLASIIVDSAREDISLERLIAEVHEEVMREAALSGGIVNEIELTRRIHEIMQDGGM
jgi:hypothetical protein